VVLLDQIIPGQFLKIKLLDGRTKLKMSTTLVIEVQIDTKE
jgi:hypothetical protein